MPFRPSINREEIKTICCEFYALCVTNIKELLSFQDANYLLDVPGDSQNLAGENPRDQSRRFVMKITAERHFDELQITAEETIMKHLEKEGFVCPGVVPLVNGNKYGIHRGTSGNTLCER